MASIKTTVRPVLAVALWTCVTLRLGAQFQTSAGSAQNPDAQEARIHRIEASVIDVPMGDNEPPWRLDVQKLKETK